LTLPEPAEQTVEVATIRGVVASFGGQYIRELVDRQRQPIPSTATRINQLVARDCHDPGTERPIDIPSVSFEVDRQENLLNDIFGFAPIQTDTSAISARHRSQERRQRSEKAAISRGIAVERGAHQQPPFLLDSTQSHLSAPYFAASHVFVTSRPGETSNIHFIRARDHLARRGDADPAALAAASLFPSLPRDLKRANLNLATVNFALLTSGGPSR
jgi:hypothetical protein